MLKTELMKFENVILRIYSNNDKGDTLGYIEYDIEISDRPKKLIKAAQFFSKREYRYKTNYGLIKEVISWAVGLFVDKKIELLEYVVYAKSPSECACRAFCDAMGGKKSPQVIFQLTDEGYEWEEYLISHEDFENKQYEGPKEEIIKKIVCKTNELKKKYKKERGHVLDEKYIINGRYKM